MQFMVSVSLDPEKGNQKPSAELSEAEFEAVRGLYMGGVLRQIWVRADRSGAFALAEADTADAVTKAFTALPMVQEGLMLEPEVVPLVPYFGFAPRG